MERILGIDLGTTNSAMAALVDGRPFIIENAQGERITPSVVSFTSETENVVGSGAARRAGDFPTLTVSSIKRFIGVDFDDCKVERASVPYTTAHARGGGVCVKIKTHERTPEEIQQRVQEMVAARGARLGMDYLISDVDGTEYSPEQISARILEKLKRDAEAATGETFEDAVITVPANFNDAQRQATRRAGKLAGFNVRRIISEPTAAALAYGAGSPDRDENILIFDLGGGTFDVSLLKIEKGVFRVIATAGDNHLGGDDWDRCLMAHLSDEYRKQRGRELVENAEDLQALKNAADAVKVELSKAEQATAILEKNGEEPLAVEVTRRQFEDMTSQLRTRLALALERISHDVSDRDIRLDRVVLVGGSTRIPSVRQVVKRVTGLEPDTSVNPDEAVALGAAIQGGLLSGEIEGIELIDVTPLSLGVETKGGFTQTIIKRHSPIPTQASLTFMTTEDGQTRISVNVLQGERPMAADNKSLGTFTLDGIPAAPAGKIKVEIIFDIDANGIVTVVAREPKSGIEQQLCITGSQELEEADIKRILAEADRNKDEDEALSRRYALEDEATHLVRGTRRSLSAHVSQLDADTAMRIRQRCNKLDQLVIDHASLEDIEKAADELREVRKPLVEIAGEKRSVDMGWTAEENASRDIRERIEKQESQEAETMSGKLR